MKEKSFKEMYEQIEVPTEDVQQSIRIGIQRAENGVERKSFILRNLSVAAILVVTAVITLGAAYPSFAAQLPIIGNIFKLFEDNEYIFKEYESYSTKLDLTKESNGVRITLTEAVYDGENITLAFIMDSEHDLWDEPLIEWDPNQYTDLYGQLSGRTLTKKLGENKYAGLVMINILNGNRPNSIQFTWGGTTITSVDKKNQIDGSWSFNLTLDKVKSETRQFKNTVTTGGGMEVELKNMTTTPISTSFYFNERADIHSKEWKEGKWSHVFYDYEVSDNLGNVYTVVKNGSFGSEIEKSGRAITTEIHEDATSIIITPVVTVLKEIEGQVKGDDGVGLEIAQPPFKLEPIEVQLK